MTMTGIDVAKDTTGMAHALFDAGVRYVGLYLRPDRASLRMVKGLHEVGIKCFSVFEKGHPTSKAYFTKLQGVVDGVHARLFAESLGMPPGKEIFLAVDYDALTGDLDEIAEYFTSAQQVIKQAGYLCSVYGSGLVCSHLVKLGLAHTGWLAQSRGWSGYSGFKPHASIVQGPEATVEGLDVDRDTIVDANVAW